MKRSALRKRHREVCDYRAGLIRDLVAKGCSLSFIAALFKIQRQTVQAVVNGWRRKPAGGSSPPPNAPDRR